MENKDKIITDKVIIVEGKYDKITLSSIVDATIITTDGFSVFNNAEKCSLLKKIAKERGIIILTDSDGAGFVIRNKLKGLLGNTDDIMNLYVPEICGKEKRKTKQSKQGILGVEGIDAQTLRNLFIKCNVSISNSNKTSDNIYTKAQLYELGYSGRDDSSSKREQICKANGLPSSMSPNAFLEAVNILKIKL